MAGVAGKTGVMAAMSAIWHLGDANNGENRKAYRENMACPYPAYWRRSIGGS